MIDFSILFPDELMEPYTWLSGVGTWEEYKASRTGPQWMHLGIKDDGALVAVVSCELYGTICGFHICKKAGAISTEDLQRTLVELARRIFDQGVTAATASFPVGHKGAQQIVDGCGMVYQSDYEGESHYKMTAEQFEEKHGRKSKAAV